MKFIIRKASDYEYREEKEFGSLEELMTFQSESRHDLIIGNGRIMIYDDYVE